MARRRSSRGHKTQKRKNHFMKSLLRLKQLKKHDRTRAISMANNYFIRQLCQNVKKLKRAKLSPKARKSLRKHKKSLHSLISNRTSMSKQRQLLSQRGGGILDSILSSIPIVGSVYDAIKNI